MRASRVHQFLCFPERTGLALPSRQGRDAVALRTDREGARCLATRHQCHAAESGPRKDVQQRLLNRCNPTRHELRLDSFDVKLFDTPLNEHNLSAVKSQDGSLGRDRDDCDSYLSWERAVMASRAGAHECHRISAIVRLCNAQRGGVKVRSPALVAEAVLWDDGVVAGRDSTQQPSTSEASQLGTRVCVDVRGISRPEYEVSPTRDRRRKSRSGLSHLLLPP
jgi:hypothetical protein